ncbi:hypothetical protein [Rhodoferax sp.]|uniref:hypothetical protein n=1 Tax=Rhodoferax sp. TaxID=50421 RepID=UPI002719C449|nr:hypothetical protein [Rhodoferax sp.]MDO9196276.1 hypothetical protein [Rhodoferax sp.]MDR3367702.1 hypothetical protein [Rhodoferax sp.]
MLRKWSVHVIREGRSQYIGEVNESSEKMARCAALSLFGVGADEIDAGEAPPRCVAIYPDDDFEVSPAA